MSFKIIVTDDCIGCGACESACENFEIINGKSNPKKSIVDEIGCNNDAKDVCPVDAIKIESQ